MNHGHSKCYAGAQIYNFEKTYFNEQKPYLATFGR